MKTGDFVVMNTKFGNFYDGVIWRVKSCEDTQVANPDHGAVFITPVFIPFDSGRKIADRWLNVSELTKLDIMALGKEHARFTDFIKHVAKQMGET